MNSMKIKFSILSIVLMAIMFTSCSTGLSLFPARQSEVRTSPIITPVKIVDYSTDFDKKVEGSAEGYLSKATNLDYYKEQATINACSAGYADFLINPTYTVSTKSNTVLVKVSGYPAKYTEMRDAVPADSLHLKYSGMGNTSVPHSGRGKLKMIY